MEHEQIINANIGAMGTLILKSSGPIRSIYLLMYKYLRFLTSFKSKTEKGSVTLQ